MIINLHVVKSTFFLLVGCGIYTCTQEAIIMLGQNLLDNIEQKIKIGTIYIDWFKQIYIIKKLIQIKMLSTLITKTLL